MAKPALERTAGRRLFFASGSRGWPLNCDTLEGRYRAKHMSHPLEQFSRRVADDWLRTYCAARNYDVAHYKSASTRVNEVDAIDCMRAVDDRVVVDQGGGRFKAARSSAHEVLFWDGTRKVSPRSTWLWLETVIIFAGVGRLHSKHGWPRSLLGTQPKGWAFDIAAFKNDDDNRPHILGEVKKSVAELERLRRDLEHLSDGGSADSVKKNSLKKWNALGEMRPDVLWLLGPGELHFCYRLQLSNCGPALHPADSQVLDYGAA